jgi:hypothetical protein
MWARTIACTQLRQTIVLPQAKASFRSVLSFSRSFATRHDDADNNDNDNHNHNDNDNDNDSDSLQYDTDKFMNLLRTPPAQPDPYPLWARDQVGLTRWQNTHLTRGCGRYYYYREHMIQLIARAMKNDALTDTSLSSNSLQAFAALSEKFSQNEINTVTQCFSPWAAAVIEGWCAHCQRKGVRWTLEDVTPLQSKVTGTAFFLYDPGLNTQAEEYVQMSKENITIGQHLPKVPAKIFQYIGTENPIAFQYLYQRAWYSSKFFVFWANIECRQKFVLTSADNGKVLFEQNGIYNHVWKFGTELPSPLNPNAELCWKVLDFDYIVHERAFQIQTEERVWVDTNTFPREILWQQGVI